jgi:hypothetical protein
MPPREGVELTKAATPLSEALMHANARLTPKGRRPCGGNTDLVSNRSVSARATRTGLHKDPVSRGHYPKSQVGDVTEFPAPTGPPAEDSPRRMHGRSLESRRAAHDRHQPRRVTCSAGVTEGS